jgi:CRISPR-associated protein Csb2
MILVLEIEHLLGVSFAARSQESDEPDWPPQPDRIFSALVAAWGARGERDEERRALEWLEAQPYPQISASGGSPRSAPVVFVPPNDPESHKVADIMVMPTLRRGQARRFPAYRPDDPIMSLIWRDAEADAGTMCALNAIAADTAYVGHSASLTRCRFRKSEPLGNTRPPQRRIYRGRLAELEQQFHARPLRRPSAGAPVHPAPAAPELAAASVFSERWLVFDHVGDPDSMPDIRTAGFLAKALRNAFMSGYREIGLGDAIPPEVSGHSADGTPSVEAHLAIAPMAFVGWPYANGAVLGFALVPPRQKDLSVDADFQRAIRTILQWNESEGRRELVVDSANLHLVFTIGGRTERRSLDPARYVAEAKVWASSTPIVLDRHLKETGNIAREGEIERLVRQACKNIDLPEPKRVVAGKHSAIEGSPSAYPSRGSPEWMRWRVPEIFASRQLTHAVVEFSEPVRGPVIIGAGRFVGLGLCLPLDAEHRR